MIPNIWHSGKGKTNEIVKGSLVARDWGEGGRNEQAAGFLGQWKYSVRYYNDGYMSLYIWPNPQNVHHQAWTLT